MYTYLGFILITGCFLAEDGQALLSLGNFCAPYASLKKGTITSTTLLHHLYDGQIETVIEETELYDSVNGSFVQFFRLINRLTNHQPSESTPIGFMFEKNIKKINFDFKTLWLFTLAKTSCDDIKKIWIDMGFLKPQYFLFYQEKAQFKGDPRGFNTQALLEPHPEFSLDRLFDSPRKDTQKEYFKIETHYENSEIKTLWFDPLHFYLRRVEWRASPTQMIAWNFYDPIRIQNTQSFFTKRSLEINQEKKIFSEIVKTSILSHIEYKSSIKKWKSNQNRDEPPDDLKPYLPYLSP